jgi:hypothetical protein
VIDFTRRRSITAVSLVALIAVVWITTTIIRSEAANGWGRHEKPAAPGAEEAAVKAVFLSDRPAPERYHALVEYFARGFVRHAVPGFARIQYPGIGSVNSFRLSGLEGFARTAPLLAAGIYSGRIKTIATPADGRPIDIVMLLRKGLLAGVDPRSPEYWGDIEDFDQRIVEAADVARVLWLTKAQLWDSLANPERRLITRWLSGATRAETFATNWELFPITVSLTLARLHGDTTYADLLPAAQRKFSHYRRLYLESGWFMDEHVDFYNAWGITYELLWMHLIDPAFESEFILRALEDSARLTRHLISPNGIPIMGRSLCYRTAVPVPVIAESFLDPADEREERGLHALDAVWRYFVAHDVLQDGALTQGYFWSDARYLDQYSGPGSCHWGLRSLVLAYMQRTDARFWTAPQAPLPVEIGDYRLEYEKLGWIIKGNRESGEIVIEIPSNKAAVYEPQPHTWRARLKEMLTRQPHRPKNDAMKYRARYYSSAKPFPIYGTYSANPPF